jgi:hypothetical protein
MATLATGLPATALTGLDLHQLDFNKEFHCLITAPPFPRLSQRELILAGNHLPRFCLKTAAHGINHYICYHLYLTLFVSILVFPLCNLAEIDLLVEFLALPELVAEEKHISDAEKDCNRQENPK